MPGFGGRHRWQFIDEVPLLFRVLTILLFINTVLSLGLPSLASHFQPKAFNNLPVCAGLSSKTAQVHAPAFVCWYSGWSIAIQFIILALMALTMLAYRKRVEYVGYRRR
jgi:hypothetical protein